jgi:hypothetical protein
LLLAAQRVQRSIAVDLVDDRRRACAHQVDAGGNERPCGVATTQPDDGRLVAAGGRPLCGRAPRGRREVFLGRPIAGKPKADADDWRSATPTERGAASGAR